MRISIFKLLSIVVLSAVMVACAAQKPQTKTTSFEPHKFELDRYSKKVENFILIVDGSTSMSDKFKGEKKLCIATDTVNRLNLTIPELGFTAGLRTFGQGKCVGGGNTSLIYGLTQYSTENLGTALSKLTCTGGTTPLGKAIDAASGDLSNTEGKIALIIVSDGIVLDNYPVVAARNIKEKYGERICIYTLQVGDNPNGGKTLEQIAGVSGCGFADSEEQVRSSSGMANFVEKVFLTEKKVEPVHEKEPPKDSDGDGVYDNADECPGTPKTAKVDNKGCWVIQHVQFQLDKAVITKQYASVLDEVARVMNNNPEMKIKITGHTCSIGSMEYNKKLSERRSQAVADYLEAAGIPRNRLVVESYGWARPVASNASEAGRAKNRRAELTPMW